jgi:hypothetical protein
VVVKKVKNGLDALLKRISERKAPFDDAWVLGCYEQWKEQQGGASE